MNKIELVDVGPRDGLQSDAVILPTPVKLELISRPIDAGVDAEAVYAFDRAVAAACRDVSMVTSATDGFGASNQGMSAAESLAAWNEIAPVAKTKIARAHSLARSAPRSFSQYAHKRTGCARCSVRSFDTGVDIGKPIATAQWLGSQLNKTMPSMLSKAGNWPNKRS